MALSALGTTDTGDVSQLAYAGNAIINPKLPYDEPFKGFVPGDMLIISGFIPSHCKGFRIDLKDQKDAGNTNILLHINIRLTQGMSGAVVRNTCREGVWDKSEEKSGGMCGLDANKMFECIIMLHSEHYKISINQHHLSDYDHRFPYKDINYLQVKPEDGAMEVHSVHVQHGPGNREMVKWISMPKITSEYMENEETGVHGVVETIHEKIERETNTFPSPYGLKIPYSEFIPGGMKPSRVIYVCGIPTKGADPIVIDLKLGRTYSKTDIALHFKVMVPQHMIVLNSMEAGKWGKEQQITNRLPFRIGVHYDILIMCHQDHYKISVNNQHFTEYPHRVKKLTTITGLEVKGSTKLVHIRLL